MSLNKNGFLLCGSIIGIIWLVFLVIYAVRLTYGVDISDEAFYNAMPISFLNGRIPYVDEIALSQNAFLFSVPPVAIHRLFFRDFTGIVLYLRILFLVALLTLSLVGSYYLVKQTKNNLLWISGIIPFTFWPFCIPSLSYNTYGLLFLLSANLCLVAGLSFKRQSLFVLLGITFYYFASIAYPSFFVVAIFGLALFYRLSRLTSPITKQTLLQVLTLTVLLGSVSIGLLEWIGLNRLQQIWEFGKNSGQGGGTQKFALISHQVSEWWRDLAVLATPLFLASLAQKNLPTAAVLSLIGFCILVIKHQFPNDILASHLLIVAITLGIFPQALWQWFKKKDVTSFFAIIALFGGAVSSWTSSNGLYNFAIGAGTVAMAFPIFAWQLLSDLPKKCAYPLFLVLVTAVAIQNTKTVLAYVYGDSEPISKKTKTIDFGPYLGLKTSDYKYNYLKRITSDIQKHASNGTTVAFFDMFPGGPLFTTSRIVAPSIWTASMSLFPFQHRDLITKFLEAQGLPETVFWFDNVPITETNRYQNHIEEKDPLKDFVSNNYSKVDSGDGYDILRVKR